MNNEPRQWNATDQRNLGITSWAVLLILILQIVSCCRAQTVHVANYSGAPFDGWKRCTVDVMPPHEAGAVTLPNGDVLPYVLGRRTGLDVRVIDLRVHLEPGQVLSIDLSKATARPFARGALPPDPLAFFGQPSIAGVPLRVVAVQADGAGYDAQLRARVGRMGAVDVWVTWYPDQPAWAAGEVVTTASNPTVSDLTWEVPADFRLRFGAADVLVPGAQGQGPCLLQASTNLGDGQARSFPVVLVWRQHLTSTTAWSSAGAAASLAICANGISKLWPDGNPVPSPDLSPLAWTRAHFADAIASLHRWERPVGLGVNERSRDTGGQEDQVFVGAECLGTQGLGAETVRYLVALAQSRRPCHHLEADGSPIDLARHPQLVFWDGRPHWHTGVSPDQLGKSRQLTLLDTYGWAGPDDEHHLINTLTIASRLTGSPACQWMLGANARIYLRQVASSPWLLSARTHGWEALLVLHCWHNLEDRALAVKVRDAYLARVDKILLPQLSSKPNDWWDVRVNELSLGTGEWIMPWQQEVGAYFTDRAGETFGRADLRALALRGAKRAMDAWQQTPTGWLTYWNLAVDGRGVLSHDANNFGMPLGPAVVLRHEPNNEKARAVWAQIAPGGGPWIAPGVPR